MAKYDIRYYGDPVLRKKAEEVKEFTPEIKKIFDNMLETMYANDGLGLAGNQVGITKRMFIVDTGTPGKPEIHRVVNPKITFDPEEKILFEEGCLSFPGITEKISRPSKVTLKGKDENGKGIEIKAEGLKAVAFQHETDHLNGVLFIDRMTPVKKMLHSKKLKEIKNRQKTQKA